jgi:hypothetical protein
MGEKKQHSALLQKILTDFNNVDFREIEVMESQARHELVEVLMTCLEDMTFEDSDTVENITGLVANTIPFELSQNRYEVLMRLVRVLQESDQLFGREVYEALDYPVLRSLQPLELLSLANELAGYTKNELGSSKIAPVWGLARIIPYLHPINQKEYAQDIFELSSDINFRTHVLDALSSLVFCLEQKSRMDMVFFFAEILKSDEDLERKCLVIDLLKKVTSSLPEKDRVMLADCLAPLIYDDRYRLVARVMGYYAKVISLLPSDYRLHYTQMIAGLAADFSVRRDVLHVIERALPFLHEDHDKTPFYELLMQYGAKNTQEETVQEGLFDMLDDEPI